MIEMNSSLAHSGLIFLLGRLKENPGGITRVILNRLANFKKINIYVKVIIFNENLKQLQYVKLYNNRGYDIDDSDFIFWPIFFRDKFTDYTKQYNFEYKDEILVLFDKTYVFTNGKFFKDSIEIGYGNINEKNITFIPSNTNITYTIFPNNIILKTEKINNYIQNTFLSRNGFVYALSTYNIKEKKKKIRLYNDNDGSSFSFADEVDFNKFYYNSVLTDINYDELFVFHDDSHKLYIDFCEFNKNIKKRIYVIIVWHIVSFLGSHKWTDPVPTSINRYLDNNYSVDAFVSLTKEANIDIKKRFGDRNIFYEISNPIILPKTNTTQRDPYRIISISRIVSRKKIDHTLKAFKIIHDRNEHAKLFIFGFSKNIEQYTEEERNISSLIRTLNLKNVFLQPYTDDVNEEYQKSGIAIFCSDWEACPLSLIESQANGCIPVSYNFKYGVRDLISNYKNGIIVENNNYEDLAVKVLNLFNNQELMSILSKKSITDAFYRNNNDSIILDWLNILYTIKQNYSNKIQLNRINFQIQNCKLFGEFITITVFLSFDGIIPNSSYGSEVVYLRYYYDSYFTKEILNINFDPSNSFSFELKLKNTDARTTFCIEWNNIFYEFPLSTYEIATFNKIKNKIFCNDLQEILYSIFNIENYLSSIYKKNKINLTLIEYFATDYFCSTDILPCKEDKNKNYIRFFIRDLDKKIHYEVISKNSSLFIGFHVEDNRYNSNNTISLLFSIFNNNFRFTENYLRFEKEVFLFNIFFELDKMILSSINQIRKFFLNYDL